MGFLDLFRPHWKHSDVDVRAKSVRELTRDDSDILAEIALKDADGKIRRMAVKKLDDAQVLREIAEKDVDESVRRLAGQRAADLVTTRAIQESDEGTAHKVLAYLAGDDEIVSVAKSAQLASVRLAALALLRTPRALADVARSADHADVRRAAVDRVTDAATLKEVALTDSAKVVALAALERIEDVDTLRQIAKDAESKAVRAAAKARTGGEPVRAAGPTISADKIRHARRLQLCREVDLHALSNDWDVAAAAIKSAQSEWAAMGEPTEPGLKARFHDACARFDRRQTEMQRLRDQAAVYRAREPEPRAAAPEPVVHEVAPAAIIQELSADDLAARAAEQAARDEERTRQNAERIARDEERAKERAERAAQRVAALAAEKEKLTAIVAKLEATQDTNIRSGDQILKEASDAFRRSKLPSDESAELLARYATARDALSARLQEMREAEDWKRWVNVPKLEALCDQAEALCAGLESLKDKLGGATTTMPPQDDAPGEEPAASIEAAAGAVPATDAPATDAPASDAPVSDATALAASATDDDDFDPQAMLREASKILRGLQADWRTVGPAPRERSEALWKRFRIACDAVHSTVTGQAPVDREGASAGSPAPAQSQNPVANLAAKVALCEKVEALKDSQDFEETAEVIKNLQADWKSIGPVSAEDKEPVWQRFRGACDHFFAARKGHLKEQRGARTDNIRAKEILCEQAEALVASLNPETVNWKETAEKVKGMQAEWKTVGPIPRKKSDALWKRFRAACDKFFEARGAQFQVQDASRESNLAAKIELCERVEAVVGSDKFDSATQIVRAAQAEWKKVGPIPQAQNQTLWKRFRKACDTVYEGPAANLDDVASADLGRFENRPMEALLGRVVASSDFQGDTPAAGSSDKPPAAAVDENWE